MRMTASHLTLQVLTLLHHCKTAGVCISISTLHAAASHQLVRHRHCLLKACQHLMKLRMAYTLL